MAAGRPEESYGTWRIPFGSFHAGLDGLSGFFVLVIALVCSLAAIYGVPYLKPSSGEKTWARVVFFQSSGRQHAAGRRPATPCCF
jgi:formate hydrogenlyase subunit 3/multisubunit Na+/H+ antiporter MnhD subunit